jgi:RNA polymerase primary sigma factor
MKEFRVEVRLKNNILLSLREKAGHSQEQMALVIGIHMNSYSELERMAKSPKARGVWKKDALAVSEYFSMSPEDLFPEAIQNVVTNKITKEMGSLELASSNRLMLASPDAEFNTKEMKRVVGEALGELSSREREVIIARFGLGDEEPKTLDEVAESMENLNTGGTGVTRERLRGIEAKALRKLRHPDRARKLREFAEDTL